MGTERRQRGRPRKQAGQSKSLSLLLRLAPDEKAGFAEAAEIAGVPLAVWIRERLRRVAASELTEANRRVTFLPEA
jgi:hypothetical protein